MCEIIHACWKSLSRAFAEANLGKSFRESFATFGDLAEPYHLIPFSASGWPQLTTTCQAPSNKQLVICIYIYILYRSHNNWMKNIMQDMQDKSTVIKMSYLEHVFFFLIYCILILFGIKIHASDFYESYEHGSNSNIMKSSQPSPVEVQRLVPSVPMARSAIWAPGSKKWLLGGCSSWQYTYYYIHHIILWYGINTGIGHRSKKSSFL